MKCIIELRLSSVQTSDSCQLVNRSRLRDACCILQICGSRSEFSNNSVKKLFSSTLEPCRRIQRFVLSQSRSSCCAFGRKSRFQGKPLLTGDKLSQRKNHQAMQRWSSICDRISSSLRDLQVTSQRLEAHLFCTDAFEIVEQYIGQESQTKAISR